MFLGTGTRSFIYDAENRQITASILECRLSPMRMMGMASGSRRPWERPSLPATCPRCPGQPRRGVWRPWKFGLGNDLSSDHLGSTRLVTNFVNSAINVVERYDYAPFGEELTAGIDGRTTALLFSTNQYPTITADSLTQKFTSKERDAETGLDYSFARYLSSAQGRFTSPDAPFADQDSAYPQSWNLYSYVRNNPLRYIDPTGRCSQASGGYTDEGGGLFPGPCSGGSIGEQKGGNNSATVGVGRDEANLIMLQGIGEGLSSPHQIATIVSEAGQGAMLLSSLRGLPSLWRGFRAFLAGEELIQLGIAGSNGGVLANG